MNFITLNEDDSSTRLHVNLDMVVAFEQNEDAIIIHYPGTPSMIVRYYSTADADVAFQQIMGASKNHE